MLPIKEKLRSSTLIEILRELNFAEFYFSKFRGNLGNLISRVSG